MRSLFLLLLLVPFVTAIAPTTFTDPDLIATDEPSAFDDNTSSFSDISGVGNVTFSGFATPANPTIIINITFVFNASGFISDEWALIATNSSGDWRTLRNLSSDNLATTQSFEFSEVWYSLENLSVGFESTSNADGFEFQLQEVFVNITTDGKGPDVSLEYPNDDLVQNSSSLEFNYSVTDDSQVETCSLFIDGTLNQTNSSPTEFNATFSDGVYDWFVRCTDSLGNFDDSLTRTLGIDLLAPNMTIITPLNNTVWNSGQPVNFTYSLQEVSNASCELSGVSSQVQSSWNGTNIFFSYLNNSEYLWSITCTDFYGRSSSSGLYNVSVVNNQAPRVTSITLEQNISPVLGSNTSVSCNATAVDTSSSELTSASAIFFREGYSGPLEGSGKIQDSCSLNPLNATARSVICSFSIPSYARAGSWVCRINVTDTGGLTGQGDSFTSVLPLYAFNLSPSFLSYGSSLQAGQTSSDESLTITNVGNTRLDVLVDGYGFSDGDGYAMRCDLGNVSLTDHRYSLIPSSPFSGMTSLTDDPTTVSIGILPGNDSFTPSDSLYWKVRLPTPANGTCSGFVTVAASPS